MVPPKNKKRVGIVAVLAALHLAFVSSAIAGGTFEPQPPDYMIEIVPGIPITLELKDELPAGTESVRFDIDGQPFITDHFAPYGDYIPTTFIDRRGISLETVHDFTIHAVPFFEPAVTVAEYHLLVHELPVIPRFQPLPLVREGQRKLIGFQLRDVTPGARVRVWGRGFHQLHGRQQLPLRPIRIGERSRTYAVRGGLTWRRGTRPQVTFSVYPRFRIKHMTSIRGRLYTAVLQTTRDGDTNIRRVGGNRDLCTDEISRNHRPPPPQSCDHL